MTESVGASSGAACSSACRSCSALVGVTSWYIVGRALRPVDAIRREVADITARDLSRRVPQPGTDDEIGRLAETMNEMLERLEAFTERQRRFVADASHELQSPLASSLADLEVAVGQPRAHRLGARSRPG